MGYHEDRYIDYLAEQAGAFGGSAWAGDPTKLKRSHQRGTRMPGYHDRRWQAGPPARLLEEYKIMEAQHACYASLQPRRPKGSAPS